MLLCWTQHYLRCHGPFDELPAAQTCGLPARVQGRYASSSGGRWPGSLRCATLKRPQRSETTGPRVGLTVPKALGKAVARNRIKRRLREAVRAALPLLSAPVDVILHPKRSVLEAEFAVIEREVQTIFRSVQAAAEKRVGESASRKAAKRGRGERSGLARCCSQGARRGDAAAGRTSESSRRCCTLYPSHNANIFRRAASTPMWRLCGMDGCAADGLPCAGWRGVIRSAKAGSTQYLDRASRNPKGPFNVVIYHGQ